jgi:hypothetical protein
MKQMLHRCHYVFPRAAAIPEARTPILMAGACLIFRK